VAELVANILRERILNGELRDGDLLPKQDDLLAQFGVSKPSVREALRILENEGLITIRRGNMGGAVVSSPRSESSAYMLALILEARSVSVADLSVANERLEPVCVSLCAERADRHTSVLPALRLIQDESKAAINDPLLFASIARRFHSTLVSFSGNDTMIALVSMVESVYGGHVEQHVYQTEGYPDITYRQRALADHKRIIDLIDKGAADQAALAARRHLHVMRPNQETEPVHQRMVRAQPG
jgi:GntR family transcriptional regulator, transcriptional repressor for pyruvate dehydrogenase complex